MISMTYARHPQHLSCPPFLCRRYVDVGWSITFRSLGVLALFELFVRSSVTREIASDRFTPAAVRKRPAHTAVRGGPD